MDTELKIVVGDVQRQLLGYLRGKPRYDAWEIIRVASRSHFIKLELFELVNCGIGRVATVIPKALLVITQSKIFRNVAVDINIEKR
jgi:hypothetical protein